MWWLNAANPAVVNAYDNFWRYTKHKYLQDHYVKAWQRVAKKFKNNPKVIGYDLMNEPHSGDITPFFEAKRLKDFYNRVIKGIRKIDKNKYLFIEPRSFGVNFGMPSFLLKLKTLDLVQPKSFMLLISTPYLSMKIFPMDPLIEEVLLGGQKIEL